MKLGIITFHHTTNFGATLQAYGLWKVIKDKGYDVEIIDYRPILATQYYRNRIINPIYGKFSRVVRFKIIIRYFIFSLIKYIRMKLFLVSNLNLSKNKFVDKKELKSFLELKSNYDAVICGSDQIWCINSIRGFDTSYFLDFDNSKCRKLSYAASVGSIDSFGNKSKHIGKLIANFDSVSVRDRNTLNLIQHNPNISATKVLDPTFLVKYEKVFDLSRKPIKQQYLLLYVEGSLTSSEISFIKFIAKEKDLTVVSVGEPCYIADSILVNLSPIDWLKYFYHTSYVITTLYHGTIFSLKFRKQFTVLAKPTKINKTGDLLNDLNLNSRFVNNIKPNLFNNLLLDIKYNSVDKIIQNKILESKSYLFESIGK